MDEFLREIEEDLQREKMRVFWTRYGSWILSACVALILGTAAGVFWNHYQRAQAMERTALLMQAVDEIEKAPQNSAGLEKLSASALTPQTAIASLHYAAQALKSGDHEGAKKLYARVAEGNTLDAGLRKLASALLVYADVTPSNAGQVNTPPITADAPFYSTHSELEAWKALQNHDSNGALKQFTALRDSATAPPGMRDRAGVVAAYLSADTPTKD